MAPMPTTENVRHLMQDWQHMTHDVTYLDWRWGVAAALFGLVAFFTKASAAFFLVALGLDACWAWWQSRRAGQSRAGRGTGGGRLLPCRP